MTKYLLLQLLLLNITILNSQNWEDIGYVDTTYNSSNQIIYLDNDLNGEIVTFVYVDSVLDYKCYISKKDDIQYDYITVYYSNGNVKLRFSQYVYNKYVFGLAKLDSLYQEYYKDKTLKCEVSFLDNKEEGLAMFYYENGNIEKEITFYKGRIIDIIFYDIEGNILPSGELNNGNGEIFYYDKGKKIGKYKFKNGKSRPRIRDKDIYLNH